MIAAVGVHDINVAIAIAFRDKGDFLPVGRPIAPAFVGGRVGQVLDIAAIRVAGVELKDGVFAAIGLKENFAAIGRPVGRPAVRGLEGHDRMLIAAIYLAGVNLQRFFIHAVGDKGNLAAIRRPGRFHVGADVRAGCQLTLVVAIVVHDPDLQVIARPRMPNDKPGPRRGRWRGGVGGQGHGLARRRAGGIEIHHASDDPHDQGERGQE